MRVASSFVLLTLHDNADCMPMRVAVGAAALPGGQARPAQRNAETIAMPIQSVAADTEPRGRERHVSVTCTHLAQHVFAGNRCGGRIPRRGRGTTHGLIAQ